MSDLSRRDFLTRSAALGLGAAVSSPGLQRLLRAGAAARLDAEALPAVASLRAGDLTLGNSAIRGIWTVADGRLRAVRVDDRVNNRAFTPPATVFSLAMADGTRLSADAMHV